MMSLSLLIKKRKLDEFVYLVSISATKRLVASRKESTKIIDFGYLRNKT